LRAVHRYSQGIPRIINNLCDKSLLSAYIRESDDVTYWDVRRAIKDMKNLTE
jgi:general secretion pathway protein A